MYSGALLATAARLAWDPSTYTWFRYLCAAQYRVSAAYVLCAGLWLAALVALALAGPARRRLQLYCAGVACLGASELAYGAWMAASLVQWWRHAPQAELARRALDLLHDLKPALLAVERYRDVTRPVYDMIQEVEREAPNNVFVIVVFGAVGAVLQVLAFVMARRLARRTERARDMTRDTAPGPGPERGLKFGVALAGAPGAAAESGEDSDGGDGRDARDAPPGWRKKANLRMYTILDKIF